MRSNDPRWIDLVDVLWHPFRVSGDGRRPVPFEIAAAEPGWMLCLPGAHPQAIHDPWKLAASLEYVLIMHSLETTTSVVPIHAAVLVRDGSALLLVGKSGTGKTTLALELVGRGWDYLSDDLAAIDRSSRRVRPFPKPLKIEDREVWERLAPLWTPPGWLPQPHGEFMVPAAALSAIPMGLVPVTNVMFLEPSLSTTSLAELNGDEAMTTARDRIRATDKEALELVRLVFDSAATFRLTFRDPTSGAEAMEQLPTATTSRPISERRTH